MEINASQIDLSKCVMHCQAKGLDSIVLLSGPPMVRIFVAHADEHELYTNQPGSRARMSLGLHAHHCDVTLIPLSGQVFNVELTDDETGDFKFLSPYHYKSGLDGAGFFKRALRFGCSRGLVSKPITDPLFLPAQEQHTIEVPYNKSAAWMVWEGKEDLYYEPITWSDRNLEEFDFSELYQPMTEERLKKNLKVLGVRA